MSRNSKNATNIARARKFAQMHKNGEKGPARTTPKHGKARAWWLLGDYKSFVSGSKKRDQTAASS